jgi:hypothetical protein
MTDDSTGTTANLDNIPYAPGSFDPAACRTRTSSLKFSPVRAARFPLNPTLLTTASSSNNLAAFPGGATDSDTGYLYEKATYGLPVRGNVGVYTSGQVVFPTFNNRATCTYLPARSSLSHRSLMSG